MTTKRLGPCNKVKFGDKTIIVMHDLLPDDSLDNRALGRCVYCKRVYKREYVKDEKSK